MGGGAGKCSALSIESPLYEMKGLKLAIGEKASMQLLRGCRVHWIRSCQRVCDRVASSIDKGKEKAVFRTLASAITYLDDRGHILACFQA